MRGRKPAAPKLAPGEGRNWSALLTFLAMGLPPFAALFLLLA